MNLLAIETSSSACSLALQYQADHSTETILTYHEVAPLQQTNLVLEAIQALMTKASLPLEKLDAITYGCGPGSFTGVRIACAIAKALGYAHTLPLIPISSMAALAEVAYETHGWQQVWVALDAHQDQVYSAHYQREAASLMRLVGEERLSDPSAIVMAPFGEWFGVGNAWDKYKGRMGEGQGSLPSVVDTALLPSAKALLPLALLAYRQHGGVEAAKVEPPVFTKND